MSKVPLLASHCIVLAHAALDGVALKVRRVASRLAKWPSCNIYYGVDYGTDKHDQLAIASDPP